MQKPDLRNPVIGPHQSPSNYQLGLLPPRTSAMACRIELAYNPGLECAGGVTPRDTGNVSQKCPFFNPSRKVPFRSIVNIHTGQFMFSRYLLLLMSTGVVSGSWTAFAQEATQSVREEGSPAVVVSADPVDPLVEPPCSYCIEQHEKGLIQNDDRVLAWIRGAHNGGAFPLRFFFTRPLVINDTYGLFFFDQNGGFVAAYEKDYGYSFHGWRNGVMVVKGPDGSLWSTLTGRAIEGPSSGKQLVRVPNLMMSWGHWLLLHPESTAYNLFEGKTYADKPVSWEPVPEAVKSMGPADPRLDPQSAVMGVEATHGTAAFALNGLADRDVLTGNVGDQPVVVFWYGPTQSAVSFSPIVNGQKLSFYPDSISPATAPFKDRETGTRWSLAGRGIDGPLRGVELTWQPGIQCHWFAWAAEYPETSLIEKPEPADDAKKDQ